MQAWPRNFPNDTIVAAIRWMRFAVLIVVQGLARGEKSYAHANYLYVQLLVYEKVCESREDRGAIGLSRWLVG